MNILAYHWVLACITDNVYTTQVGYRRKHCVGTVEQCHFACMIRFLVVGDKHVQACLVCGKLFLQLLYGHVFSFFDNPQVESLGLDHKIVLIADLLLDFADVFTREAWNNSVDKRCTDEAIVGKPILEAFIVTSEVVFPQFYVLIDTFFQPMPIEENQFTRHDNHSFVGGSMEILVTVEQELNQLAGIAGCRLVCKLAGFIKGNTSFSGVGNDKSHLGLLCQSHESLMLCVGVEGTADSINTCQRVDWLTIFFSLQIQMIEAILSVEPVNHAVFNRLNYNDRSVEVCLLIHVEDNPVNKGAEKITFSKLDDSLRHSAFGGCTLVQGF